MRKKLTLLIVGAFAGFSAFAQNLVVNGGFELPDDGIKHLFITERAGWFSDDMTSNQNGTEHGTAMVGNYYQYCVNTAGTIYQPIDKVSDKAATYKVSYLSGVTYNPDSGNDTIYSVAYFSHYSPGNIGSRTLIDSIATDITAESWKSQINVEFNIPAAAAYAGDSLVIEFATRVWDHNTVNTNTWTNMDSVVVVKVTTFNLPIVNGGFELPDDGVKHLFITERAGWFSDDMTSNHNGAEHNTNMVGNYNEFSVNTAGTIYQPIDIVTNDSADYTVKYLSGLVYNPDPGNDTIYTVAYLSHYSSGNIKTRTIIDSVATDMTSESWKTEITATFKIPAGAAYAGDSLALEFATRVWDHHTANTNTWTGMDSVVVVKTGDSIPPAQAWTTFLIAKITDGKNLPSNFAPSVKLRWDNDSIYMVFDVNDTLITTTTNSQIWNDDNIELYFDMTNGKKAQWPRTSGWPPSYETSGGARIPGSGYYQFRLVPDSSWAKYNGDAAATANLKYVKVQGGYQFYLNIPWDTLYAGFEPSVGKIIGFDVNVSDNNVTPDYRSQVTWNSPTTNIYADAALWGMIQFQPNGLFSKALDQTAPSNPKNLKDTVISSKVTLSWDASTDNIVVDKYIVSYGTVTDTLVALQTGNKITTASLAVGNYTFGVVAVDVSGNKSGKATKKVDITTNISKLSPATLTFDPNPAINYIELKNVEPDAIVKFYCITGQNIFTTVAKNGMIDVSRLKKGIYLIKVESGKNVLVSKMIKE